MKRLMLLSALCLNGCSWWWVEEPARKTNKALSPEGVVMQYYTWLQQGACEQLQGLVVQNQGMDSVRYQCNNEQWRVDLHGATVEFTQPMQYDAISQSALVYVDVKYKNGQRSPAQFWLERSPVDWKINAEKMVDSMQSAHGQMLLWK
ncbi:MAG: hypothetical protein Q4B71_02990 [Cardiobacteriaceae bacterium]|nr:hypothetical protein [Cardiobacteriaceae bacterium]